jgi:imidazole glycerol phosphate synthase subunit HisF
VLTKRLIACFDIIDGRVTKAVQFQDNIDVAPEEELAEFLYQDGVDELIFYDIMASVEKRPIDIETVKKVARRVFIPFTVEVRECSIIWKCYLHKPKPRQQLSAVCCIRHVWKRTTTVVN